MGVGEGGKLPQHLVPAHPVTDELADEKIEASALSAVNCDGARGDALGLSQNALPTANFIETAKGYGLDLRMGEGGHDSKHLGPAQFRGEFALVDHEDAV